MSPKQQVGISIHALIVAGSVLYFSDPSFNNGEPHYFVVLNQNPKNDHDLILVNATTNTKGRITYMLLSGLPMETLVRVEVGECQYLKQSSIFDCNRPTITDKKKLAHKQKTGRLRILGVVTKSLLQELRNSLLLSPQVIEAYKQLIR